MLRNRNGHFELVTKKKTDGTMSLKVKLVKQLNYEKRHKYQLEVSITTEYNTMCHECHSTGEEVTRVMSYVTCDIITAYTIQ